MRLIILFFLLTVTSCTSAKSTVGDIESLIEYRYDKSMFTVFSWMSVVIPDLLGKANNN